MRPGVEPGCSRINAALVSGHRGSASRWTRPSGCLRCSCIVTFLTGLALVGVARAAAAPQGDQPGSIWGGITVLDSIDHVRTARTAYSWHIARFDDDNCVLDIRCFINKYANKVWIYGLDMGLMAVPIIYGSYTTI